MSHPPNAPGPQGPDYGQEPTSAYGHEAPKKRSRLKWGLGCLGLIILGLLLFGGCAALLSGGSDDTVPATNETVSAPAAEETEDAPTADAEAAEAEAAEAEARAVEAEATEAEPAEAEQDADQPSMTRAQQNAIGSAENYIDFSAFSRTGLIEQLEFEGYSTEDATFAVDSLDIDYNAQAAKSAENYLEFSSFSRSGLIEQLMFEGYTEEQATYGVDQTGL